MPYLVVYTPHNREYLLNEWSRRDASPEYGSVIDFFGISIVLLLVLSSYLI